MTAAIPLLICRYKVRAKKLETADQCLSLHLPGTEARKAIRIQPRPQTF
jgi:hypothetical protein